MKKLITLLLMGFSVISQAQTVDEIIEQYFENTGGKDTYEALQGRKITAKLNQQGMEFPIVLINLKDGRQLTEFSFQGNTFRQEVFDGTTLWSDNPISLKSEKLSKEETENFKKNNGDFPDSFLGYKERGWTAELLEKESVEGTDCFKIKLTKLPEMVNGVEQEVIEFHYFDTEYFVPIMTEMGVEGEIMQIIYSDYQEIDGLMFPFSLTQSIKGGGEAERVSIEVTNIELDPEVSDDMFAFKETAASEAEKE